jgi:hypothetical protein
MTGAGESQLQVYEHGVFTLLGDGDGIGVGQSSAAIQYPTTV